MSLWRRLPAPGRAGLTLASVALVFFLYWLKVPLLDLVELRTYDLRFQSRGDVAAVPDVVLAVVDEKSLDALGRWPWSRARIAELVDALSAGGARVIAFDIGFLEREAAAPDRALARAIERSPAAVVLGYFFHMASERGYDVAPEVRDRELERLEANALTVRMRASDLDKSPFAQAKAVEGNLPELADAAEGAGFFTLVPDDDGVVRRTPLVIEAEGEVYPSLALVAAWNALGQPPLVVDVVQNHVADIQLGDRIVPTDEGGNLLVNFPGKAGAFPQVSISDVLAGDVAPDRFRDKIVLVGVTATAVFDLRATPFGPVNPGLEVQAAALDNLLSGRFMSRPGWADLADQLAIVLLGVTTGLLLAQLGALSGLVATALLAVAYVALAEQLFVRAGAWIGVTYPLLALVVVYTAITLHAYLREQRERRRVSGAFGQYVSPVVIEQMLADPEKLRLGGEERVLTVLFCDLAGFTGIAERNSPQTTIELLSEYYARMTEQIYACEGMLKEYVGDELMAIFGAPLPQPDHAVRACRAALALREARLALSQEWMKLGRPRAARAHRREHGAHARRQHRLALPLLVRRRRRSREHGVAARAPEPHVRHRDHDRRADRRADRRRIPAARARPRARGRQGLRAARVRARERGRRHARPRAREGAGPLSGSARGVPRAPLRSRAGRARRRAGDRARGRSQPHAGGALSQLVRRAAAGRLGARLRGDREVATARSAAGRLRVGAADRARAPRVQLVADHARRARVATGREGALAVRAEADVLAVDDQLRRSDRRAVRDELAAGARDRRVPPWPVSTSVGIVTWQPSKSNVWLVGTCAFASNTSYGRPSDAIRHSSATLPFLTTIDDETACSLSCTISRTGPPSAGSGSGAPPASSSRGTRAGSRCHPRTAR
jgi:adenylate cyclase